MRITERKREIKYRVLIKDFEHGREVDTDDLLRALLWRTDNQRREITRLNNLLAASRTLAHSSDAPADPPANPGRLFLTDAVTVSRQSHGAIANGES